MNTERSTLEITGDDREHFLQGIVTNDVTMLGDIQFAALLSPQGKILHDFFLVKRDDAILLDVLTTQKDVLLKRLNMYKLRAKVAIRDASEIKVGYGDGLPDPRHPQLPCRNYSTLDYHAQRLTLGIPDTTDLAEDTLLDAGYDLLNAVSFTKGCFVGQEVTARMHYKNIARRGFYVVESAAPLPPPGTQVIAAATAVGTLRGSISNRGLAMLKFAEIAKAQELNMPLLVDNTPLKITLPKWMEPKLAMFQEEQNKQ